MHRSSLKMLSRVKLKGEKEDRKELKEGDSPGLLMGFTRGRVEAGTKKQKGWRGKERKPRCTFTRALCSLGPGVAEATREG